MAIPQDGLSDREIQLVKAYESTASILGNPALAEYVKPDELKVTMGQSLEEALESAAATLASDHAKFSAFLEAVKTEASTHGLSTVAEKVESLGAAHGAGAASGSGAASEPSPAPGSSGEAEESEDGGE